jgi:RecA-family ATPase
VRQFVQFCLGRLARLTGGTVLACAHPSRAGQSSGTGESGSVQWDAAVRSRLYLYPPHKEANDDAPPVDPDARLLTRVKANYAPRDETIELLWREGAFVVDDGILIDERPNAETLFLQLLDKRNQQGRPLSFKKNAGNYAPKEFAGMRSANWGYRVPDFREAMEQLFERGAICNEQYGKPSDNTTKLVRGEADAPPAEAEF